MYIKLGILYATAKGSFSRDKSRAVIFENADQIVWYLEHYNLMHEFAAIDLMHAENAGM